ncbi:aldehyde oxidase/xanthine dehydrogenase-like protein [Paraburkholderia caballeronis]|uniref:hypothetical protein n=1 Tax=Paraburkholderia caballeronis TaxID=416943 RepID=UPI0010DA8EE2|nr:hypothetical protein [Paraburkholderia caballeronis]TDV33913.1 aldehyde oxidase/xanthine dehydrogenase-like protein [Paraburkholderia caballeronis]
MTKRPPHPNGPDRPQGIGASPTRREDGRFMRGRGEYVGNLRMVGTPDVAFVRSPVAHGHIVGIGKPAGFEHAVDTLADLDGVKPIVANSGLPGFKSSEQPALAGSKVRPVGRILPGPHKVGRIPSPVITKSRPRSTTRSASPPHRTAWADSCPATSRAGR